MSSKNPTLTERVTNLEGTLSDLAIGQQRLIALLEGDKATTTEVEAPKAAKAKKGGRKARKTAERKPAGTTIEGKTCLVMGNRKQFIADHEWAQNGTSTKDLANAVVNGAPLTGNWALGAGYAGKFGAKGAIVAGAKGNVVLGTGKAPKTSTKVVAEAAPEAPAKVRRANGTIAPKAEWDLRTRLAAAGLDPKEVDAAVVVANA